MGSFQFLTEMVLIRVLSPRATEQMHPQNLMLLVDIITQKTNVESFHKPKASFPLAERV